MTAEIEWPAGFERTPPRERTEYRRYQKSLHESVDELADELDRIGADEWRLSSAARQQKRNPNYPYADSTPDDPSSVVRWTMDDEQFAVACDSYTRLRDNVRTIGLYIREKRKMQKGPVETGQAEFANARLPPGEDSAVDLTTTKTSASPYDVLNVAPDASAGVIKAAARELKKQHHPDNGGSRGAFQRVVDAEEAILGE